METASQVDTQLLLPNYTRPTHIQQQIARKKHIFDMNPFLAYIPIL